MGPVYVWTTGAPWFTADAYPDAYERFEVMGLDSTAPLPDGAGVLLADRGTLDDKLDEVTRFVRNGGAVIAVGASDASDEVLFDEIAEQPTERALVRALRNAAHYVDTQVRLEELNQVRNLVEQPTA